MTCPENGICTITVNTLDTVRTYVSGIVYCPVNDYECIINVNGDNGMFETTIYGGGGVLSITVEGNENLASAIIHCPVNKYCNIALIGSADSSTLGRNLMGAIVLFLLCFPHSLSMIIPSIT